MGGFLAGCGRRGLAARLATLVGPGIAVDPNRLRRTLMSRRLALLPSVALAITLLVVPAARGSTVVNAPAAATPTTMTYQGILRANGAPANGVFSLQFKIYNVPMGGAALYTETDSVTATNGL